MADYDVLVIGSGVGGHNAAIRAGQLGLKVACIEKEAVLGGTCLNVGCMPSKALLHASEMYELAKDGFAKIGIKVEPELDLDTMMQQKADSVASLLRGVEYLFKKYKVDRINGHGRLCGDGIVSVTEPDGHIRFIEATHIIIATGSYPATLPGVDIDQKSIVDSTAALVLPAVPERLIVIGGGVIGLELGSVWRRLGGDVEIIEYADHLIPGADAEIAKAFGRILDKQGMKARLSTKVIGAKTVDDGVEVTIEPRDGGAQATLKASTVLVAVGRRPYTHDLGLEAVGIDLDAYGFIPTHDFRTAVPGIWAIGDVIGGAMLAHKAEEEAVACVELIAGQAGHVSYDIIPSVIYTAPEVAWVGKTEEQVKALGINYKVGKFPFSANGRAKLTHEAVGLVKVISDQDSYQILGVHMIGPAVSEIIGEACVAMEFRADSEDVARTPHAHPTRSEAFRQAAMDVDGWTMQF